MTKFTFAQLVDMEQIRQLLDSHHKITGVCTSILDADENILVAVGWQDICTRFHRVHPDSCERCRKSDAYIKEHLPGLKGDCLDYRCRNGLQEVAVPIIIDGEHLATLFTGQFFYDDDRPDVEYFRKQAEEFGFDESGYLAALSCVPVFSHGQIRSIMDYFRNLVQITAELGLKNIRVTQEVEERKKAEKDASFFRTLIEYTRDPVYVLDPDDGWRMVYANQAACSHYGMEREQLLTQRIPDWDPEFDMENIDNMWQQMKQNKSMRFETMHRLASGELIPVEVSANYLVHNGKELSAGYFYKIAERKAMEAAMRESEHNLIEAQRIARVGNWAFDLNGNLLLASAECYRIFGVDVAEFAGTFDAFLELVHPDDRRTAQSAVESMLKNRLPCSVECRIIRPDGAERIVRVLIEIASGDDGKTVRTVGTVQDITEQSQVLETLREKDLLLLQQSRLAAKGEMINYIAHQWRQPLTNISVLVQGMKDDYEDGEFNDEYLEHTVEQIMNLIRHMSCTIDDFRGFYKADKEVKQFDLKEITRKTLSFIADTLKENKIEAVLEAREDMVITGYPNEYSHVLLNILNNAREALVERQIESPRINIHLRREGERTVIAIKDNAGGISPNIIGRVFDAHFTTKDKGTGIGLYMTKTIVEKHMKGCITVNNVDDGAEFRIEL
jgi:PAS domain S-box-containing protein